MQSISFLFEIEKKKGAGSKQMELFFFFLFFILHQRDKLEIFKKIKFNVIIFLNK